MKIIESTDGDAVAALLDRPPRRDAAVERRVAKIVADVRRRGDAALLEYAKRFDGLNAAVEVPRAEIVKARRSVPDEVQQAIALAAGHIRAVAEKQVPRGWRMTTAPGVSIEQRVTPLERVGCYVPGGRYPLPSSLLMTAIPARVAGVREVIVVCPKPDPTVLFAALTAGVDRVFRIGGAQAVAAMAYGTRTVPRVDKIVGPGNVYVAAAKALVSIDCSIDFFAGPSEIVMVSSRGNPAWIAADLLAQAEHDPNARAILLTPSKRLARAVAAAVAEQLPADGPAAISLEQNGGIVVTRTLAEAVALCQRIAPEHVVCDDMDTAARLTIAGTVFVGDTTAQALGDYTTGSNHVLPTSGAARARAGLSAADFVRVGTVQHVSSRGLRAIGPAAIALATAEGLTAHAASIAIRMPRQERASR
jgi:histidinol dehydrogenase